MKPPPVLLGCLISACGAASRNTPAPARPEPTVPAPEAHPAPSIDRQDGGAEPPRPAEIEVVLSREDEGQVFVTAPAWGSVKRVLVEAGALVKASDPLFEISPPPPPAVAAARAELKAATLGRKRQEELHRLGEPERDLKDAMCAEERARSEIDRARRGGGAPRPGVVVRAPAGGEVGDLYAEPGTMVEGPEIAVCTPSLLAVLYDPTRLRAVSTEPPSGAVGKTPLVGASAKLRLPGLPGKTFGGRVVAWGKDRVVAGIDNPDRLLRAGMKGTLVVEE